MHEANQEAIHLNDCIMSLDSFIKQIINMSKLLKIKICSMFRGKPGVLLIQLKKILFEIGQKFKRALNILWVKC